MEESILRVLVDRLLVQRVSYPELFRTRETYLTAELAAVMDVQLPLPQGASNGAPGSEWTKYEFPENDPRAGFLTMPAFTALNAHPGKSSPTLRGKAIRENLLCQKIPDPPANVDFTVFNDVKVGPTARDRLEVHRTSPTCGGCHRLMDPIGLGLENFDGAGGWRTAESGAKIDASGSFNDVAYTTAAGLDQAIGNSQAAESCLISRVYAYGTSKMTGPSDQELLKRVQQQFVSQGRQYPALIKLIATSPEFFQLSEPKSEEVAPPKTAQVSATTQKSGLQ